MIMSPGTAIRSAGGAILAAISAPLWAAPTIEATPTELPFVAADSGDTGFMLVMALLAAITLVPGILLFVASRIGRAHLPRMAAATALTIGLTTLLYFMIGYSLVFDVVAGSSWLGGATNWMLNLMGTIREETTVPETAFVIYHLVFVWIAATVLAAVLAPRARSSWLLGFAGLWFLLVQVPVMRWLVGGGWLAEMGAIDSAGGLFAFYTAGASAMVALVMIGAKPEDPTTDDSLLGLGGAGLMVLGIALLCAGATLGAGDDAGVAVINVLGSALAGMFTLAAVRRALGAEHLALGLAAGALAAAAGGDAMSLGGSLLNGIAAGLAVWLTPRLMPRRFAWQDRGLAAVTMTGAAKTGAFMIALLIAFIPFGGSDYAEGMSMGQQLIVQTVSIIAVAGWSILGTTIAGLMVSVVAPMRDGKSGS